MKADQDFLNLTKMSSCFGRETCIHPPCACVQSLIDLFVARAMEQLQDHYWDSLSIHKDLILQHARDALTAGKGDE